MTTSRHRTIRARQVGILAILLLSGLCGARPIAQAVMPVPHLQFFTNAGAPCSSCTLTFSSSGTPTPLNTYSNQGLSIANPNPLTLNSAGRPSVSGTEVNVYLTAANYRVVLKTSGGTTLWTADGIYAVMPAIIPTTYAVGDLLYASTTGALARLADVATGSVLVSGGLNTAPAWSASPTLTNLTITGTCTGCGSAAPLGTVEGRLSVTSGTPVTTGDTSAAATLYWEPYKGNRLALYDGASAWTVLTFTQTSLDISGCTASKGYDVFAYNNSSTVALETLVWTNATSRATALTTQDGVLVKTGATTRRYLASFYCNASGGQTDDTFAKRYVWNYYNRVPRVLKRLETTGSWNYTTATVRQANNSALNQVEVLIGWAEVRLGLSLQTVSSNTNADVLRTAGFGEDSTTTFMTTQLYSTPKTAWTASIDFLHHADLSHYPAVGLHVYSWNEDSSATGATTWRGVVGTGMSSDAAQYGITGVEDGG